MQCVMHESFTMIHFKGYDLGCVDYFKPKEYTLYLNYRMYNCLFKVEVGCLRHPGASTIGSQFPDGDISYSWQILAAQPWPLPQKGQKQEREGRSGEGKPLTRVPTRETLMLMENADPRTHGILVHVQILTLLTVKARLVLLAVFSVKLRLCVYSDVI